MCRDASWGLADPAQQSRVCGTFEAFAVIVGDGSVETWGEARRSGDRSAVQHHLKNVQQIRCCHNAFAAILDDGSVVTWGDAECGGDSSIAADPSLFRHVCCHLL